ncbi:hypothetical protein, partial [Mesorhizobium sp. M7A.F.Ca.CA.001.09.2.1]|uniref:hypothetical protein n=1 Tax=Mesorhizobium sp. M7A.F.Ca.CA.001.09.2.1 TaxID=2496719 RepID=UPI0019D2822E
ALTQLPRGKRYALSRNCSYETNFTHRDSNWPFRAVNSPVRKQRSADVDFPQKTGRGQTPDRAHALSGDLPSQLRCCIGT